MKKYIAVLLSLFIVLFCASTQPVVEETEAVTLNVAALKGPTAMGMVKLMEDAGDE